MVLVLVQYWIGIRLINFLHTRWVNHRHHNLQQQRNSQDLIVCSYLARSFYLPFILCLRHIIVLFCHLHKNHCHHQHSITHNILLLPHFIFIVFFPSHRLARSSFSYRHKDTNNKIYSVWIYVWCSFFPFDNNRTETRIECKSKKHINICTF